jgi:hypothetical protein
MVRYCLGTHKAQPLVVNATFLFVVDFDCNGVDLMDIFFERNEELLHLMMHTTS